MHLIHVRLASIPDVHVTEQKILTLDIMCKPLDEVL